MFRQIGELCGQNVVDVIAQIKGDPFGSLAGIYNIKAHLHQMKPVSATDLLWSSNSVEPRPITPPEYRGKYTETINTGVENGVSVNGQPERCNRNLIPPYELKNNIQDVASKTVQTEKGISKISPRILRPNTGCGLKPPSYKVYDNGDCPGPRLPSIDEHCNDTCESKVVRRCLKTPCVRKICLEEERPRLHSCPDKSVDSYRKTGNGFSR